MYSLRAFAVALLLLSVSSPAHADTRAFRWRNGVFENLPGLGGSDTRAYSVSIDGRVVGHSITKKGAIHAVYWTRTKGPARDMGILKGAQFSIAYSVNSRDEAVGESGLLNGARSPVLFTKQGKIQKLPVPPGYASAAALRINDKDQVLVFGYGNIGRSFVLANGQYTDIGALPGRNDTVASAMNNLGQVVGVTSYLDPVTRNNSLIAPFIWQNGVMQEIILPDGVNDFYPFGINDQGQIVGRGSLSTGESSRGMMVQDGQFTLVSSPQTSLAAINGSGVSVGFQAPGFVTTDFGFLWHDGILVDLGKETTSPDAIGADGTVVGEY